MTVLDKLKKFCAYQERSSFEVKQKLLSLNCSQDEIQNIVNELITQNFLNEQRFVDCFIKSKMHAKAWGRQKISFQLFQKGIPQSVIDESLSKVDEDLFAENMSSHFDKWKKINVLNIKTKPKLIRYLISKGFSYEEIMVFLNNKKYDYI